MKKERMIEIPDQNSYTGYSSIEVEFLGKGSFCTCYVWQPVLEDIWVISFLRIGNKESDYSKEAIALYCDNSFIPQIENLGYSKDERFMVFKSPFYAKLEKKFTEAWLQAKMLKKAYDEIVYTSDNRKLTGYEINLKIIDRLTEMNLNERLLDALIELNDSLCNYDDSYRFEFPTRNLKVDEKGNLILLDVIFNSKALRDRFES